MTLPESFRNGTPESEISLVFLFFLQKWLVRGSKQLLQLTSGWRRGRAPYALSSRCQSVEGSEDYFVLSPAQIGLFWASLKDSALLSFSLVYFLIYIIPIWVILIHVPFLVQEADLGLLELKRTKDLGKTFKTIGTKIYSFGLGGCFLFASVMTEKVGNSPSGLLLAQWVELL